MYDTLMQMGRWFGYRLGYLDLCRLYTTDELVEWYQHITVASEELRKEFDYMSNMNATPEEFGLKVRTHPSGLIITGANKMRNGTVMKLSFAGRLSETYLFYKDEEITRKNLQATQDLISRLGSPAIDKQSNFVWEKVIGAEIVKFLGSYQSHPNARLSNTRLLIEYIDKQLKYGELTSWTIVLISNSKPKRQDTISGLEVGLAKRDSKDISAPEYRLPKARLLSPPDEMLDFSETEQKDIMRITNEQRRANGKPDSKNPDTKLIRERRNIKNALLLLYPLFDSKTPESSKTVIGFGISFPQSTTAKTVEYRVNNTWEQELLDEYDD